MPLVKNTLTGNHYLVKINTESDLCLRTAIRSYDKQLGAQGVTGNTVYQLPFTYEPYSHTLWIFVNGQKAEFDVGGVSVGEQLLKYTEPTERTVQFWDGLNDDDVIEFIVVGSYFGDGDPGTGGGGTGLIWTKVSVDTDCLQGNGYLVDCTTQPRIMTLPDSPSEGDIVAFEDVEAQFDVRNCTIARNGNKIMSLEEDLVLNQVNQGLQLVYDGVDDWRIVWTTPHINNITLP